MRRMGTAALVAALALAAAGCGGSSDESGSDTTAGSGTLTGPTDGCASLAKVEASFSAAMLKATSGSGASVAAASQAFGDMADQVPDAVSDDFQTLATAFGAYAEALKGIKIKAGKAPNAAQVKQLLEAAKALDQKDVDTASANIDAWVKKNCR